MSSYYTGNNTSNNKVRLEVGIRRSTVSFRFPKNSFFFLSITYSDQYMLPYEEGLFSRFLLSQKWLVIANHDLTMHVVPDDIKTNTANTLIVLKSSIFSCSLVSASSLAFLNIPRVLCAGLTVFCIFLKFLFYYELFCRIMKSYSSINAITHWKNALPG